MTSLPMTYQCAGCKRSVGDSDDMLVEFKGQPNTVAHVDHLTMIGLRMRAAIYGPYHDEICWALDAREGESIEHDIGRFAFDAEPES